ncbi:hypothetical protein THAOC_01569, partial [Thalassiosira oceanica]
RIGTRPSSPRDRGPGQAAEGVADGRGAPLRGVDRGGPFRVRVDVGRVRTAAIVVRVGTVVEAFLVGGVHDVLARHVPAAVERRAAALPAGLPSGLRGSVAVGAEADDAVDFDAVNERTNLRTVVAFQFGTEEDQGGAPFSGPWGPSPLAGWPSPGLISARPVARQKNIVDNAKVFRIESPRTYAIVGPRTILWRSGRTFDSENLCIISAAEVRGLQGRGLDRAVPPPAHAAVEADVRSAQGSNITHCDGDASTVKCHGMGWAAALCSKHVMRAGKHYASFILGSSDCGSYAHIGLIRPIQGWDKRGLSEFPPSYLDTGGLSCKKEDLAGEMAQCIVIFCKDSGFAHSSDFSRATYLLDCEGRGDYQTGLESGLLLGLDDGTLTVYQEGQSVGVLCHGLTGVYSWLVWPCRGDIRIERGPVPR